MERGSLTISRKLWQAVDIGETRVTVTRIAGDRVHLRIEAPRCVKVLRCELTPDGGEQLTEPPQLG